MSHHHHDEFLTTLTHVFCWMLLTIVIIFFHVWHLSTIPVGLYSDETSIGLNAATISQHGVDQYGTSWPVFFKAFGEYKNPLYIYGAAAVFSIFGISDGSLRLTSALFFFWFIIVLALLIHRMWRDPKITFFAVLSTGFLPYFFPLSRIAFEVVSQLPVTVSWLLLLHITYINPPKRIPVLVTSFSAGIMLGLSLYAYSTCRLLAFAFLAGWMVVFLRKTNWKLMVAGLTGFFVACIPYLIFNFYHPGALTGRFSLVSYWYRQTLTIGEKFFLFFQKYTSYFSPQFLLIEGDKTLRHATGFGGAIFATIFFLVILGFIYILKYCPADRFARLILFVMIVSPLGAAVGIENAHVLRSVILGLAMVILSTYGLMLLKEHASWNVIFIAVILMVAFEASYYVHFYFTEYPAISAPWFENQGLHNDLVLAVAQHPEGIVVSSRIASVETSVGFYRYVIPGLDKNRIQFGTLVAKPGFCNVYADELEIPPTLLSFFQANQNSLIKLRCYGK